MLMQNPAGRDVCTLGEQQKTLPLLSCRSCNGPTLVRVVVLKRSAIGTAGSPLVEVLCFVLVA
jgi:hypothetical protein